MGGNLLAFLAGKRVDKITVPNEIIIAIKIVIKLILKTKKLFVRSKR